MDLKRIGAVVLSAGKGTRLNCVDIPKVMLEVGGKPMVSFTVNTLNKMGLSSERIVLVVGFKKEKVIEYFNKKVTYAVQKELKGTADAAFVGMKELPSDADIVLVMGGDDSAFYKAETLLDLVQKHLDNNCVLSLLSAEMENPDALGRVVRHENGDIEIIEKEYLTEEQKKIKEISTGTFVFDRKWFTEIFPTMPPLRKLGEYGLPTAMAVAREQKQRYQVVKLSDPSEWHGVNTLSELEAARKRK